MSTNEAPRRGWFEGRRRAGAIATPNFSEIDMRRLAHKPTIRHGLFSLPLFDWANQAQAVPLTNGGRSLNRRAGIPHRIANALAELNGIGLERC